MLGQGGSRIDGQPRGTTQGTNSPKYIRTMATCYCAPCFLENYLKEHPEFSTLDFDLLRFDSVWALTITTEPFYVEMLDYPSSIVHTIREFLLKAYVFSGRKKQGSVKFSDLMICWNKCRNRSCKRFHFSVSRA
jgi:hypothetical protein